MDPKESTILEDPKKDLITGNPKEDSITEDSKENPINGILISFRTLIGLCIPKNFFWIFGDGAL